MNGRVTNIMGYCLVPLSRIPTKPLFGSVFVCTTDLVRTTRTLGGTELIGHWTALLPWDELVAQGLILSNITSLT
jgi:hypothetical protein